MPQAPGPQDRNAFLNVCLLESDSEIAKRARRIKQRAILISIILQILVVALLVLIPLLGKGESIASRVFTPTVPYSPGSHPHPQPRPAAPSRAACHFCDQPRIPTVVVLHDPTPPNSNTNDEPGGLEIPGAPTGETVIGGQPGLQTHIQAPQPPPPATIRRSVSGTVEAALLTHRVEPEYPPLARQLHREGRVELRAIISTDGSIQSLEIIAGDPLFYQSVLAAVRDWHYRPTILDGQPVEVDTQITVIYTLSH
jgi:periplasmic protein TonB